MDRCYENNMKEKPSEAANKLAEMICENNPFCSTDYIERLAAAIEVAIDERIDEYGYSEMINELREDVKDLLLNDARMLKALGKLQQKLKALEKQK